MRLLRSFFIAFSIYSRIPVPQFSWEDEDMKYMLCFFPWIGAVIGGILVLWGMVCERLGIGDLCFSLVGAAVPVFVTGGFHVDGFMDTMDAFHSWQPKERKLEILKDSHIGAFSVIMLAAYGLVYVGAFSEIRDIKTLRLFGAGFFLSRALSGIGVVCFKSAKTDGLLYTFADTSKKRIVRGALAVQAAVCAGFMVWTGEVRGFLVLLAGLLAFAYYYFRCKKELDGITGDTAGYFVLVCEECMLVTAALTGILI